MLSLHQAPWSTSGSYLQLVYLNDLNTRPPVVIGSVRRRQNMQDPRGRWLGATFGIETDDFSKDQTDVVLATPSRLVVGRPEWGALDPRQVTLAFSGPDRLILETGANELRLVPLVDMSWAYQLEADHAVLSQGSVGQFHMVSAGTGSCMELTREQAPSPKAPQHIGVELTADGGEVRRLMLRTACNEERAEPAVVSVAEAAGRQSKAYETWASNMPAVDVDNTDAAEAAWWMLWNQRVKPKGTIGREAIVMSRFYMNCVWPWDACFSALGIGEADPCLAWDQVMVHIDLQAKNGQLPDAIHDTNADYNFCKPPVQGFFLSDLFARVGTHRFADEMSWAYERLSRWAKWWLTWRLDRSTGLPIYMHGNDSGWDNATIFDSGEPVVSPDLATYLVLHCEALAAMAGELSRPDDQDRWTAQAYTIYERLLEVLVESDRFVARRVKDGKPCSTSSLITRLPILLADRLPGSLVDRLVKDVSPGGRFLNEHCLATEALDSPLHEPDGYWRGPMWAPPTYFVFEGLRRAGREAEALELAHRYCRTCSTDRVMYENYRVSDGRGLRSRSYSWTAAVFIRLAHLQYLDHQTEADIREVTSPTVDE